MRYLEGSTPTPIDPWNGGPWAMWKGTKYAHIMMPILPTPKLAAAKGSAGVVASAEPRVDRPLPRSVDVHDARRRGDRR
jgi:hypothetical protein